MKAVTREQIELAKPDSKWVRAEEAEQQIKELKKYTQHSRRCGLDKFGVFIPKVGTRTWDCTCGLDKLLNKH